MAKTLGAVLVLLLFLVPSVGAELPRHVDPLIFGWQNPPPGSLFDLYGLVFNTTAIQDFGGAEGWLGWADRVNATSDLAFLLSKYNILLNMEVGSLNSTSLGIASARALLKHLSRSEAMQALKLAREYLAEANTTLAGVDAVSRQLGTFYKTSPAPLLAGGARIAALIELFDGEILLLQVQAVLPPEGFPQLTPTDLRIEVVPGEALVGSSVSVSGVLTESGGAGLPNRFVDVFVDDGLVVRVEAGIDGAFTTTILVPYLYRSSVVVSAEYWPGVDDVLKYLPSASNAVEIKLIYYSPDVVLSVPSPVFPGRDASVSGSVKWDSMGVAGLRLRVAAFNSVYSVVTGADGSYSLSVSVPGGYPEGSSVVVVDSLPGGVYGPSGAQAVVDVVRIPLSLEVVAPSWVVAGTLSGITGRVTAGGVPLANCSVVVVSDAGVASVVSSADGSFRADQAYPLGLATADTRYRVSATPAEPWIRPAAASGVIFVVNLLVVVGGPVLLAGASYYGYRQYRRRPRRPKKVEEELIAVPVAGGSSVVVSLAGGERGSNEVYSDALELVGEKTGVRMGASMTLREYLSVVRDRLGAGWKAFRSLTLLYERWLYDPVEPQRVGVFSRLVLRIRALLGHAD